MRQVISVLLLDLENHFSRNAFRGPDDGAALSHFWR